MYFIYFKFKPKFFKWVFFNSIQETHRFRTEINRLLSKGISNICLKVSIEKKGPTQNFDILSLKISSPSVFGEL